MTVERAKDGEKVKSDLIDEKKLTTIMKRFLGTKESDPDETKYYRVEDGINFMATTYGSAVQICFQNKHAGSFTKGTGKNFFRKPLPKDKYEDVDFIPEMETITDGKKKIKKPTGRIHEYPDIASMFNQYNLAEFGKVEIPVDDIDQFIAVHEAMEKAAKVGGMYNTAQLGIDRQRLTITLYDSPLNFTWEYWITDEVVSYFTLECYHYDYSLMKDIFKSLKDLKVDAINMYVKDINNPILFVGSTMEYNFQFAIARKLTR